MASPSDKAKAAKESVKKRNGAAAVRLLHY